MVSSPELVLCGAGVSTLCDQWCDAIVLIVAKYDFTNILLLIITLRHPSKWTLKDPLHIQCFHVGGSSLGEQRLELIWYVYIITP